ncbi:MAG TPA: transglutaminase domain-containing protein [Planctomycetota bacterium]|nr:transglutaminase domain-containing protein [Planctomycetota bacterium]
MFEKERGRNQAALIDNPLIRDGVKFWMERCFGFYGEQAGGVDIEVIADQIILNEKTKDYLYSEYTPKTLKYVPGTRPMLEQIVRENIREGMSQREKALALMRRCRDNAAHGLARPNLFYGGHEEDLLRRGAIMCNEISRVFVCLCQIASIPARLHAAHISGHMMAEVLTDGKWGWIDPMMGIAPVNDKDEPASAWELKCDPKLFERQPRRIWEDVRSPGPLFGDAKHPLAAHFIMARNRDCYHWKNEAIALGNYFVWEHHKYTYPWRIDPADPARLAKARHDEQLNRKKLGWVDYYYDHNLFNETLPVRD